MTGGLEIRTSRPSYRFDRIDNDVVVFITFPIEDSMKLIFHRVYFNNRTTNDYYFNPSIWQQLLEAIYPPAQPSLQPEAYLQSIRDVGFVCENIDTNTSQMLYELHTSTYHYGSTRTAVYLIGNDDTMLRRCIIAMLESLKSNQGIDSLDMRKSLLRYRNATLVEQMKLGCTFREFLQINSTIELIDFNNNNLSRNVIDGIIEGLRTNTSVTDFHWCDSNIKKIMVLYNLHMY